MFRNSRDRCATCSLTSPVIRCLEEGNLLSEEPLAEGDGSHTVHLFCWIKWDEGQLGPTMILCRDYPAGFTLKQLFRCACGAAKVRRSHIFL